MRTDPWDSRDTPDFGGVKTEEKIFWDPSTEFKITLGLGKTQLVWNDQATVSFDDFAEDLSQSTVGPKDGTCYTPAIFSGNKRNKQEAVEIGIAALDADCGHTRKMTRKQMLAAYTPDRWPAPDLRLQEALGSQHELVLAHHEAGHAVAAWYLQFDVIGVTLGHIEHREPPGINLPPGAVCARLIEDAHCLYFKPPHYLKGAPLRLKIENEIITYLAGAAAEERFTGRGGLLHMPKTEQDFATHGRSGTDYMQALKAASAIWHTGKEAEVFLSELNERTHKFIDHKWRDVKIIAEALLEKRTIDGEVVRKLLEVNGGRLVTEPT